MVVQWNVRLSGLFNIKSDTDNLNVMHQKFYNINSFLLYEYILCIYYLYII